MQVRQTEDGSSTLYVAELNEHYHSIHGAVQESLHVFIDAGLRRCSSSEISIFELGFGTGLNALLTAIEAERCNVKIHYHSIEKYPVPESIVSQLNYTRDNASLTDYAELFAQLHGAKWDDMVKLSDNFYLHKILGDASDGLFPQGLDLVYFDAFAPDKQPELWDDSIFKMLYSSMNAGASLVTYCAKGALKRSLRAAGFVVEGLPGPPGKREMTRAIKK